MQRRFLIVLVPLLMLVLVALPGGLSVQAMGEVTNSVTGPLALTDTAEPSTPVPPPPPPSTPVPPTPEPATPVPPTSTPAPSEGGERRQRTAVPTETPVPPAETPSPTPELVASPTPTPTPVPAPVTLPRTGSSADNSSLLLWLGIGTLTVALGGSLIRRRSS